MSYKVKTIPFFDKQAKRLTRKFQSFKYELSELFDSLEVDPTQGISIGNNGFKIRMSIKSKGKGKSGGARVITHVVHVTDQAVYLLSIYDKSDQENIPDKELQALLKLIE